MGDDLRRDLKAPHLVLEDVPVSDRALGETVGRPVHALEGVLAKVRQLWHRRPHNRADPSLGLVDELIFVVIVPHRAERCLGEVPDLVPLGRSLAGDQVCLVVTVEMYLICLIAELFALQQFIGDRWVAGGGHKRREPVQAGHDPV